LNARAAHKSSAWAVMNKETGLLSIFPNYRRTIEELTKVESKQGIMRKLVSAGYRDKFKGNGIDKIFDDTYLDAYNTNDKIPNKFDQRYDSLKATNPDDVMTLDIPGLEQPIKAIVFGKDDSFRALFKIKDKPGADDVEF
jgi:hypothetical protein